jgi:uncharacterized membrane protein
MSQSLIALSYWLHSLATVVLIGYFLVLAVIILPSFIVNQDNSTNGTILSEISKRSRGWLYAALVIFILSGIYLTLADVNYLGLGKFGNTWSVLMLVKHILVVGMILIGLVYNAVLRIGPQLKTGIDTPKTYSQVKQYAYLMSGLGVMILLLTAISQVQ